MRWSLAWIGRFHYLSIPFVSLVFGTGFLAVPLLLTKLVFDRKPAAALVFFPAILVVAELVKSSWFLKFPFANIGYTQARWLLLIQIADVTGIWGIQFLVALVNILLFYLAYALLKEKRQLKDPRVYVPVAVFAALAASVFSYAGIRVTGLKPGDALRLAVIQTNQDPRQVWMDSQEEHLQRFEKLSRDSLFFKPRLLLFPEGAVDAFVRITGERTNEQSVAILNRVSGLAKDLKAPLLIGAHEEALGKARLSITIRRCISIKKGIWPGSIESASWCLSESEIRCGGSLLPSSR